jgi:hypothetical protein
MTTNTKFSLKGKARDSYLELVVAFPLASIKYDRHLEEAQEVMDRLLAKGRLDHGEEMYLDALRDLVAACEDEHHAIEPASDADMLRHFMEAKGVTPGATAPGHRHCQVNHFGSSGRQEAVQSAGDPQAGRLLQGRCQRVGGQSVIQSGRT